MNKVTISLPTILIHWKSTSKLLLLVMIVLGLIVFSVSLLPNPNDFQKKTEQNKESSKSSNDNVPCFCGTQII